MTVNIVCLGKLKEAYWRDACAEYAKRLSRFTKLAVYELAEERLPDNASPAQEQAVIDAESAALLKKIDSLPEGCVIALDVGGKQLSSEELAGYIDKVKLSGKAQVTFVIGGSLGYNDSVRERADLKLSFSAFTFPHQLMRVVLLEQIYRAFKISAGEKYHK